MRAMPVTWRERARMRIAGETPSRRRRRKDTMESGRRARPLDAIRKRLEKVGLRKTAPRLAVLERLEEARTPLSHSDMVEMLVPKGFDPATIYRNLKDLAEAGLVVRRDLGDHTWRYELARRGAGHARNHPHFVCEDCGTVACLDTSRVNISAGPGAPRAILRGGIEVHLKGRCDDCN